jgi:hypothetical protein
LIEIKERDDEVRSDASGRPPGVDASIAGLPKELLGTVETTGTVETAST